MRAADVVDGLLTNPKRANKLLKEHDRVVRHSLKTFSWFIYRITQPAMRNMFMRPNNWFRIEEGALSLLSGDLFGDTKIKFPLFMFKVVYYVSYLLNWRINRNANSRRLNSLHRGKSSMLEICSDNQQAIDEAERKVAKS